MENESGPGGQINGVVHIFKHFQQHIRRKSRRRESKTWWVGQTRDHEEAFHLFKAVGGASNFTFHECGGEDALAHRVARLIEREYMVNWVTEDKETRQGSCLFVFRC